MKKSMEKLATVFSEAVERHAAENHCPLMEAMVAVREEFGIDEDTIGNHVTDHLKAKLYAECQKTHTVKRDKAARAYAELFE